MNFDEIKEQISKLPVVDGEVGRYDPINRVLMQSRVPDGNGVLYVAGRTQEIIAGRTQERVIVDNYSRPDDFTIEGKFVPVEDILFFECQGL